MTESKGFVLTWGKGPLAVYVSGILLPVVVAHFRPELMSILGITVYAVVFWAGPFASAAAVAWSEWSTRWRIAWALLVPVFVAAAIIVVFVIPT